MTLRVKIAWGLIVFNIVIFLAPLVKEDTFMFSNFLPSLKSLNLKWIGLVILENMVFNLFTTIALIIGIVVYRKHDEVSGLNLIKASIAVMILTLIFY